MKYNDITAVASEKDGGCYFRNQVVFMPDIRSGIAASLAGPLTEVGRIVEFSEI